MWDTTVFGHTTSGGGFMNGTTNEFDSPSGKKKEQVRRVQSVVPLVTRQINECNDEDFKLFGLTVQIANLVGILRNFEVQSTKATCNIEDHTGTIKAILWLENDNDTIPSLPPVKEGSYVQVYGSIRNQDGEKIIMILKMFPVDDCNVITNHLLQVIHARLAAEDMAKSSSGASRPVASASSMSFADVNMSTTNTNSDGLTPLQDKVFDLIQKVTDTVGLGRDVILKNFRPNQTREVNDALEFLLSEGHAYTTIDNDHFKSTSGF